MMSPSIETYTALRLAHRDQSFVAHREKSVYQVIRIVVIQKIIAHQIAARSAVRTAVQ